MKKFFTSIPFQPNPAKDLIKCIYRPVGDARLVYEKEHSLPILNVINNFADDGEEIEVIFIIADHESTKRNLITVEASLDELVKEKKLKCTKTYVEYENSEDIVVLLDIFKKLINHAQDEDVIFSCITYGKKPVPIVQLMAMRYAYNVKKRVNIRMIVYGDCYGKHTGSASGQSGTVQIGDIYDMTSLFYMDDLAVKFGSLNVKDPEKLISAIISGSEEN